MTAHQLGSQPQLRRKPPSSRSSQHSSVSRQSVDFFALTNRLADTADSAIQMQHRLLDSQQSQTQQLLQAQQSQSQQLLEAQQLQSLQQAEAQQIQLERERVFIKPHKHIYNACSYWNSSVVAGCQKRHKSIKLATF